MHSFPPMLQSPKLYDFIPKLHIGKIQETCQKHKDKIILSNFFTEMIVYTIWIILRIEHCQIKYYYLAFGIQEWFLIFSVPFLILKTTKLFVITKFCCHSLFSKKHDKKGEASQFWQALTDFSNSNELDYGLYLNAF